MNKRIKSKKLKDKLFNEINNLKYDEGVAFLGTGEIVKMKNARIEVELTSSVELNACIYGFLKETKNF